MKSSLLPLIKDLITVPSEPDNAHALDVILERALLELPEHAVERFEHKGVKSALVYNRSTRPDKFTVVLNAHLDIIPAKPEQYTPRVEDSKLYGAGAMDMKSGVACLIKVFNDVAREVSYPLALQLTTDEEIGGFDGTKYQISQGIRADFVLAGEPTNLEIVHKAKGILQAKIHAEGETAHGAYPWRGDNALWKLHEFLDRLKTRYPIPEQEVWQTTVNLSGIETPNRAFNKVPDTASASLDIRFIPEDQTTIKDQIQACLPEGCTMEVVFFEPAMQTPSTNDFVEKLGEQVETVMGHAAVMRGANGSSDARHFASVGGAGVEFGPIGGGIGSDDEWVDIVSLKQYCHIVKNFLLDIDKEV